jgi:hypothetical protein
MGGAANDSALRRAGQGTTSARVAAATKASTDTDGGGVFTNGVLYTRRRCSGAMSACVFAEARRLYSLVYE